MSNRQFSLQSPVSSFQSPVSGIWHLAFDITSFFSRKGAKTLRVKTAKRSTSTSSGIRHPASGIRYLVSHTPSTVYPASAFGKFGQASIV